MKDFSKFSVPAEYTAIISPNERAQRRLAQYPLDEPLPSPPFPHTSYHIVEKEIKRKPYSTRRSQQDNAQPLVSLRSQHLSAISAALHKCLQKNDYVRASRALGLILRTDLSGGSIDIRESGYWGIGAEILLRRDKQEKDAAAGGTFRTPKSSLPFTRKGFEDAKAFYENLIIQHPYSKLRPTSVNAIDFYLAMFSSWIYVAQAEASRQQAELDDADASVDPTEFLDSVRQSKLSRLAHANAVAVQLDKCISAAPYSDNKDLLRIRAMVAAWQADLNDDCQEFTQLDGNSPEVESGMDSDAVTNAVDQMHLYDEEGTMSSRRLRHDAAEARALAQRLFDQLRSPHDIDD